MAKSKSIHVDICRGCEGLCIYVGHTRIIGEKPWGGGKLIQQWEIDKKQLLKNIKDAIDFELRMEEEDVEFMLYKAQNRQSKETK